MNKTWAYAAILVAAVLWGFGFVFGKYALAEMPYGTMVTYRFVFAAVALLPLLLWRRIRVERKDFVIFILAGICYVPLQFLLQFAGLAMTSLTHAALMVALLPALIAIASTIFARGARPKWWPIGLSGLGAIIIVMRPGGTSSVTGDMFVLLSLAGGVAWVLLSESVVRRYDAIASSAYILWAGTLALVAFEAIAHPHDLVAQYSAHAWLATIASAVLCTAITTVLWNLGLRAVPASDAGVFINIEPLIGAVAGIVLFGDPFGWTIALGAAVIVAGAIIVTKTAAPPVKAAALISDVVSG